MVPQCVTPTVKHGGGSVMISGSFAGSRVGDLHRVTGTLNQKSYHSILQCHAIPSGLRLVGQGFIPQQDNDPKHLGRTFRTIFDFHCGKNATSMFGCYICKRWLL